jgi:hypothetical protein
MSRDWEAQLRTWSTPPGVTEQEKMERAEKEVRAAIAASRKLAAHDVDVFPQGSYRNRTNVPRESDVDICVRCNDTFFYEFFPEDTETIRRAAAISPASYGYWEFKNDVAAALVARFGRSAVKRGDKAFNVRETTYRVEADVVATFQHRRYTGLDWYGRPTYLIGTEFVSDSGKRIVNWPQQHYDNGVAKNQRTRERFKAMVRVLKNLRNEMDDAHIAEAGPIPSYFIECLVYNVPDSTFGYATYYDTLKEILRFIYLGTETDETARKWLEVNELKYLFHAEQPWTRAQGNAFVLAAWRYVGYRN